MNHHVASLERVEVPFRRHPRLRETPFRPPGRADSYTEQLTVPACDHLVYLMESVVENLAYCAEVRLAGPRFIQERYVWEKVTNQLLNVLGGPSSEPLS